MIYNAKEKLRITLKEFEYKPTESRDREKQRHELKSKSDNANVIILIFISQKKRQFSNKHVKKHIVIYISLIYI